MALPSGLRPIWRRGLLLASTHPTGRFDLQWAGCIGVEAFGLISLYVVEPVRHSAPKLEVNWALAEPAPAFEGTWRNIPTFRKLILVEMTNGHIRAPHGARRHELPHCDTQIFAFIGSNRYGRGRQKL
jgi:hypothetical protein